MRKVWDFLVLQPLRLIKDVFIFLSNMNFRQVRSVFSMALLGGIISLSFMNIFLIVYAQEEKDITSLFAVMAKNQQFWNNIMMAVFAVIIGLVVWGATRFRAKYGEHEFSADTDDEKEIEGV